MPFEIRNLIRQTEALKLELSNLFQSNPEFEKIKVWIGNNHPNDRGKRGLTALKHSLAGRTQEELNKMTAKEVEEILRAARWP